MREASHQHPESSPPSIGQRVLRRIDELPAGTFRSCPACTSVVYARKLEDALWVCPDCAHHFPLDARRRIELLTDPDTFVEQGALLRSEDPLRFTDSKPYRKRLEDNERATGSDEAAIYGTADVGGIAAVVCVLDFAFLGGSMGSVVGEKVTRAAELAIEKRRPLIVCASSGGARMQEGVFSLLQMAKTSAALAQLSSHGLPFVSVLADPVFGGVAASFANLGDVIVAEPKARAGFAGARIIRDTIRQDLPDGFQTAEFLLEHGHIDAVVPRAELRATLVRLLRCYAGRRGDQPAMHVVRLDPRRRPAARRPQRSAEGRRRSAWSTVQLARHPERPHLPDYIDGLFDAFFELRGDRWSADDPSLRGGVALLGDHTVVVAGNCKGCGTREAVQRNFGMAHPSGYRKAMRLMRHAEQLGCPLVTLIDTPGAYPGLRAEQENQSGAIAQSLALLSQLRTPVVAIVAGEGGSGGALALGVGDRLLMLENTTFSVISPEGCASLLFRDAGRAPEAAESLRMTAADLDELGLVDAIVAEPPEGAHSDRDATVAAVRRALVEQLEDLAQVGSDELLAARRERIRSYGRVAEIQAPDRRVAHGHG
ncbi:MAG TPA: acetyl-CoA carboxylase carboxyltransferase subunit alpha [Solirubrobacteraceae bacterium]|jgi:acetyl-CoA carboxylase carboxyl transferase subunit beta|nr:acetyl-CoA carboxylase carboxyltransferase subunit alpha [Solirubrobacteraceae bacterium]